MLVPLSSSAVERVVRMALEEDAPWGDLTSEYLIPLHARVKASLVAREDGTFCGADLFRAAMQISDPAITVNLKQEDGTRFTAGAVLATADGPARGILRAERVALNFVQRLSGIASLTARFVSETKGTKARIVDTRKTTPGLRYFERYAVRCGGGFNHRFSLSDAVMAKDNHLAVVASNTGEDLTTALVNLRARLPHTAHIEVEVDLPEQIAPVLAAGVQTILLDNFSIPAMREAVEQIRGRAVVEASGSIRLEKVAEIARTGVDVISVGALTHSVRALDLGLDVLPEESE